LGIESGDLGRWWREDYSVRDWISSIDRKFLAAPGSANACYIHILLCNENPGTRRGWGKVGMDCYVEKIYKVNRTGHNEKRNDRRKSPSCG
jgi:hypothetical protein